LRKPKGTSCNVRDVLGADEDTITYLPLTTKDGAVIQVANVVRTPRNVLVFYYGDVEQ